MKAIIQRRMWWSAGSTIYAGDKALANCESSEYAKRVARRCNTLERELAGVEQQ